MHQRPIINLDAIEPSPATEHGDRFKARIARVSQQLGAKRLGYNVTVVEAGKRAFPFHNHQVNEELFLILAGSGMLRFGNHEYPVRQGDLIACPPGGPEVAHQIVNTGTEDLRYLAVSTTIDTDVFQYPDSGKFGVVVGRQPGQRPDEASFVGFYRESDRLDYWDGE